MANTGMCHWTAHCQSTELDTRHKRAIIKRNLISTNRSIHLYIIWIRTPGKFKLSFRSYNRLTQHRPCLTRNLKRSNSCFLILQNLIRRGLEKFKMLTANRQKRHQWQMVEPQQKHKHKIQLCMYLCFYKTHLGSYTEPAGHLVHYSLLIWSHTGTTRSTHSILKQFFSMEPSNKANTVCVKLVRPCNSSKQVQVYSFSTKWKG